MTFLTNLQSMRVRDLRREHRLACKALLDSEMAIVKLEEKRGKLVTVVPALEHWSSWDGASASVRNRARMRLAMGKSWASSQADSQAMICSHHFS